MHKHYRIDLDDALPMLAAARAKAEELGVKQTICVCDDGGHVIALHRLPGARLTGVDIAVAKAFTSAGHERATHKFNEPPNGPALPGNEAFGISHMMPGKFAIFVGGFPIEYDGQIVGAVG
ncbi:MAG: GlcG/HbpS family heme-binding protein, partial [Streptosporangiaceae bacterium]